jgi:hypothetical protein
LLTLIAITVIAYAASSLTHELIGHGTGCLLTGVKPLLLSSIILTSAGGNRIVDAAGPVANIVFGVGAFYLFLRRASFNSFSYFLWLFAAFNLLVAAGYLFWSGLMNVGDWAFVIQGLRPAYAWRTAICVIGAVSYLAVVRLLARSVARIVSKGKIARGEVPRLIFPAYLASGVLAVASAALNPISTRLIWVNGFSGSFLAFLGMLRIPSLVGPFAQDTNRGQAIEFSWAWVITGAVVAIVFVVILGPGIKL